MASPTRVGSDTSAFLANGSSSTTSHTVPSTGQNRVLIVLIGRVAQTLGPDGVTWNGTAMTKLGQVTGAQQTDGIVYYLANPAAGTFNIVADWTTNNLTNTGWIFAATYQDMVQNSGTVTDVAIAHQSSGSSSHPTLAVTTNVDSDIVISWTAANAAGSTLSPDSPQSQIASQNSSAAGNINASDQPKATAGSITSGFTYSGSATSEDMYAIALKYVAPSAAGSGGNLPMMGIA